MPIIRQKTRTAAIDSMKKFGQNIVDFILTSKRSGIMIYIISGRHEKPTGTLKNAPDLGAFLL